MYVPAVTCYTAACEMLSKFSVRCTCRCIVLRQSPKLGSFSLARSLARGRLREALLREGDATLQRARWRYGEEGS